MLLNNELKIIIKNAYYSSNALFCSICYFFISWFILYIANLNTDINSSIYTSYTWLLIMFALNAAMLNFYQIETENDIWHQLLISDKLCSYLFWKLAIHGLIYSTLFATFATLMVLSDILLKTWFLYFTASWSLFYISAIISSLLLIVKPGYELLLLIIATPIQLPIVLLSMVGITFNYNFSIKILMALLIIFIVYSSSIIKRMVILQ